MYYKQNQIETLVRKINNAHIVTKQVNKNSEQSWTNNVKSDINTTLEDDP